MPKKIDIEKVCKKIGINPERVSFFSRNKAIILREDSIVITYDTSDEVLEFLMEAGVPDVICIKRNANELINKLRRIKRKEIYIG